MPLNSKLEFQHTNSYIRETLDSGNFINYVLLPSTGITTQEHRFCVNGETTNALVMTNDENGVNFLKATTGLNTGVPSSINVNNLDTTGDVDMVFERNNVEFFRLDSANSILNVANAIGVSTSNLYANNIRNRSLATDTIYYGAHSDGVSPQVEYMRYDMTI